MLQKEKEFLKLFIALDKRDTETNYEYFGARYYDSEIGRWLQVDPLADKLDLSLGEGYHGWSRYNLALIG